MKGKKAEKARVSKFILNFWMRFCKRRNIRCFSRQLEYEISSLNPGMDAVKLTKEHYEKKISLCLMILGAGVCITGLCLITGSGDSVLYEETYLKRDSVGGEEKIVELDAEIGKTQLSKISVSVEEQVMDEKTAKAALNEIAEKLPHSILGENESLEYVSRPLQLPSTWQDLPVSIFWESSDPQLLKEDGTFGDGTIPANGKEITLTADLYYGEITRNVKIESRIYPPDLREEERLQKELNQLLEKEQADSRTEKYFHLPEQLKGEPITWREPDGNLALLLLLLVLGTTMAVFTGKDLDVHKQYEERNKQLMLEYPEFVSRLQLFICSGMSIRSAFFKMGKEYQKSLQKGGKKKVVNEELLLAIRKMENGMSETEALDYFGRRCHLYSYKKMVSLIQQNLKRGADGLREALMNETRMAFEERKQTARKSGEEAGTKLLLPMMLMLGIVMVIIMVPAYFSFGGLGT